MRAACRPPPPSPSPGGPRRHIRSSISGPSFIPACPGARRGPQDPTTKLRPLTTSRREIDLFLPPPSPVFLLASAPFSELLADPPPPEAAAPVPPPAPCWRWPRRTAAGHPLRYDRNGGRNDGHRFPSIFKRTRCHQRRRRRCRLETNAACPTGALLVILGASWADLGPSWAVLGRTWRAIGPTWGGLRGLLGSERRKLEKARVQKNNENAMRINDSPILGVFLGASRAILEPS